MEKLSFTLPTSTPARGTRARAIVGVVASGNLEVLLERLVPPDRCEVRVETAVRGFAPVWEAVVRDIVARRATGSLRISIHDGGARPDTVALRVAQGIQMMEEP